MEARYQLRQCPENNSSGGSSSSFTRPPGRPGKRYRIPPILTKSDQARPVFAYGYRHTLMRNAPSPPQEAVHHRAAPLARLLLPRSALHVCGFQVALTVSQEDTYVPVLSGHIDVVLGWRSVERLGPVIVCRGLRVDDDIALTRLQHVRQRSLGLHPGAVRIGRGFRVRPAIT